MVPNIPVDAPIDFTGLTKTENVFPITPDKKNNIGIFLDVKKTSKYEVQIIIIILLNNT